MKLVKGPVSTYERHRNPKQIVNSYLPRKVNIYPLYGQSATLERFPKRLASDIDPIEPEEPAPETVAAFAGKNARPTTHYETWLDVPQLSKNTVDFVLTQNDFHLKKQRQPFLRKDEPEMQQFVDNLHK